MSGKENQPEARGKRLTKPPTKTTYGKLGELSTSATDPPQQTAPSRAASVATSRATEKRKSKEEYDANKKILQLERELHAKVTPIKNAIKILEQKVKKNPPPTDVAGLTDQLSDLQINLSNIEEDYAKQISFEERALNLEKQAIDAEYESDQDLGRDDPGTVFSEHADKPVSESSESDGEDGTELGRSLAMDQLAKAITRGLGKGKPNDLPFFNGTSQIWPMFSKEFKRTTKEYQIGNSANLIRLRKALKGPAREAVSGLLDEPECVPKILKVLESRFGRPEFILEDLIEKVKDTKAPEVRKPETTVAFGTMVQNLVARVKSMGKTDFLKDGTLLRELVKKLPPEHGEQWLDWILVTSKEESLESFGEWMERKVVNAERLSRPSIQSECENELAKQDRKGRTGRGFGVHAAVKDEAKQDCLFCEKPNHSIEQCFTFKKKPVNKRKEFLVKRAACFACLKVGHRSSSCDNPAPCQEKGCRQPSSHHTLLHGLAKRERKKSNEGAAVEEEEEAEVDRNVTTISARHNILPIIPVVIKGESGKKVKTFALLDTAASFCMMEQKVADELGLEGPTETLKFSVFQDIRKDVESKRVSAMISGDFERAPYYKLDRVHTVKEMGLPPRNLDVKKLKEKYPHLKGMRAKSLNNARPQLLIGINRGGLFAAREILEPARGEAPAAVKSLLGWYLIEDEKTTDHRLQCMFDTSFQQDIHEFIAQENLGVKERPSNRSKEDEQALQIFESSANYQNNKWTIALPWRNPDATLPPSYTMALNRLHGMEKKMLKNEDFRKLCHEKFDEYIRLGYLKKWIGSDPNQKPLDHATGNKKWYLPWFFAYHPSKKPRLVFDGAAKAHGKSLNDFLLTGPDLLCPLNGVLLRFRRHSIALTADIKTMFHQVLLRKDDWPSQTILYRKSQEEPIEEFVMTVLFFGAASSPSAASFVKNLNAKRFESEHPEAVEAILKDFYVDDFLSGAETADEAIRMQQKVTMIHEDGGFPLVKWNSNSQKVLGAIPSNLRAESGEISLQAKTDVKWEKTLGMLWNPLTDEFSFKLSPEKISKKLCEGLAKPTKRMVASVVMSVFDPLGFLAVLKMKGLLLIQKIWKSKIDWDDEIPEDVFEFWLSWLEEIKTVTDLRIPRKLCSTSLQEANEVELHVFCDASDSAYACAAYLRINTRGSIYTPFIMGKVRVGPLKGLTIPRMELNAALIGTRIAVFIKDCFANYPHIKKTIFWTDSMTVLQWIRATDKRLPTYVANRIGEITEKSHPDDWKWVPSEENVADDATKVKKAVLTSESRWFHGPDFLKLPPSNWPIEKKIEKDEEEEGETVQVAVKQEREPIEDLPDAERFSSWFRLIRATAAKNVAIRRFRKKARLRMGVEDQFHITMVDMKEAERAWVKRHQAEYFAEELQSLKREGVVHRKSRIAELSPSLNNNGIIVSKGRLENAKLMKETIRPPILDSKGRYVELLIRWYHQLSQHYGQERIINEIRKTVWILHLRAAVKRCRTDCLICKKNAARPVPPEMGQLPEARVLEGGKPFKTTGVDYFGPIMVKVKRSREKRWGVIFTCLATRAVHLEVAESLSTGDMINCLIRFVNTRGHPEEIWSDNGTNFVGAERELRENLEKWNQSQIRDELHRKGIEWNFIPPAAPHMGGAWERLIRDVKRILGSLLKINYPTVDTLRTLLAEVTGILNSRPLTGTSPDPDDPRCLTPNDLLHLDCVVGPTIAGEFIEKDAIRETWRKSEWLAHLFWKRWSTEYLPWLAKRQKWTDKARPLQVGDVVLVLEDNAPKNNWKKGLISKTFEGKDGQVRIVEVKIASVDIEDPNKVKISFLKRPVIKLCPLF